MTGDDVELIMFPIYAASMSSLAERRANATCTTAITGQMYELAKSPRGVNFLNYDKKAGCV